MNAILRWFVIIIFIVSVIWLISEPAFESFLTLLTSLMSLITMLAEQNKTVSHATHELVGQDSVKNVNAAPSTTRSAKLQSSRLNLTESEWVIVDDLQAAFMPLKSLVPIVSLISTTFCILLFVMMAFEADAIAFVSICLLWLFLLSNIYIWKVKKWYKQVETTDFYSRRRGLSEREKIKNALCQRQWGNTLLNLYMRTWINFLLKTDKREANKADR